MFSLRTVAIIIVVIIVLLGVSWYALHFAIIDYPEPTHATLTPLAETSSPIASASASPSSSASIAKKNHMSQITLQTSLGDITFETYDADAPKAVDNFVTLAKKGFYKNLIFHRVIKGFMIQGGDPSGNGTGGPGYSFEDELNPATESYKLGYVKGVVAMANAGPNTNGSQFFIMLKDTPLPHNYTVFGKVISGQEVVDAIGNVKTGAGDRPVDAVTIKSVIVNTK